MSMYTIHSQLKKKKIVYTDNFNLYNIENADKALFDNFNFIINDIDVVNLKVFPMFVNHVNEFKQQNELIKVYVNPNDIYSDVPCIFTKHPNSKVHIAHIINSVVRIFNFPFKVLKVATRKNNVPVNTVMMNLEGLSKIYSNKIWTTNPSLSKAQNTDILFHKLMAADVIINEETFQELSEEILKYKNFKMLNIEHEIPKTYECSSDNLGFTQFGLNLTIWP